MGRAARAQVAQSPAERRAGASAAFPAQREGVVRWIDFSIEAAWLVAAVFVPLIVLSEGSFVSFTALPKVAVLRSVAAVLAALLAVRWAFTLSRIQMRPRIGLPALLRDPRLAVAAAILLLVVLTAMSTVLSVSPHFSLWGKDPGYEGNDLYTSASYAVLGLALAFMLRTRAQLLRLLGAIAVTGTVAGFIGVLQNFGVSPLGISATSGIRVTGTSGNPIFFGAVLTMTLPITLGVAAWYAVAKGTHWRWWAVSGLATAVQVLALTLTLSRGPWIATALGVGVLVALVAWRINLRLAAALGGVLVASVVVTVAVLNLATAAVSTATPEGVSAEAAGERALDIDSGTIGGLSGRVDRWRISSKLAIARPEIPEARNLPWGLRVLTGYGPDMFRHAFAVLKPAEFSGFRTDAAHNDLLTRTVETGLLGVLAYLVVLTAAALAIWRALRGNTAFKGTSGVVIAAALMAALVGHIAEHFFGIPQAGDSTIFWLLVGAAASSALRPAKVAEPAPAAKAKPISAVNHPRRTAARRIRVPEQATLSYAAIGLATAFAVALLTLTWIRTVNYVRADHIAAISPQLFADDPGNALERIELATRLAPDVWGYAHRKALMVQSLAGQGESPERRLALLRVAAAVELAAAERNPLSIDANLAAAHAVWQVAQAGDPAQAVTAIALYERLAELVPNDPVIRSRLEQLRAVVKITPAG